MRRFFVEPEAIESQNATITGSEANHIRNVLRLKAGDRICLIDGRGGEFEAELLQLSAVGVRARILSQKIMAPEPKPGIILAQAMLKDRKMDELVSQMTEVGVDEWIPFFCKRSIPKPAPLKLASRMARWEKIAGQSLKQCRRSKLLRIREPTTLDRVLDAGRSCDVKLLFWENETGPLKTCTEIACETPPQSILAIVGPEGGFAQDEVDAARRTGFSVIGLGPRILRAETAGVAAGVLLQYIFGDMGR